MPNTVDRMRFRLKVKNYLSPKGEYIANDGEFNIVPRSEAGLFTFDHACLSMRYIIAHVHVASIITLEPAL